jgi:hypothetical protein
MVSGMASGLSIFNVFVVHGQTYEVQIVNHKGKPVVMADDIGKVSDMVNIRGSIQSFDADEKVIEPVHTLDRCTRDAIFLTERGLYRLLMVSQKTKEEAIVEAQEEIQALLSEQAKSSKKIARAARHEALVSRIKSGECLMYFGRIREEHFNPTTNDIMKRSARLHTYKHSFV